MLRRAPLFAVLGTAQHWNTCTDCIDGVVMGGADVVHYWGLNPDEEGVIGSKEHAVEYEGFAFYFRNASNAATFHANPAKYMPAYGGFCNWGVAAEGTDHNPNPDAEEGWPWTTKWMGPPCNPHDGWIIINGRLSCAVSRLYTQKFRDIGTPGVSGPSYADARWTAWFGGLNSGPMNNGCFAGPKMYTECRNHPGGKYFPNRTHTSVMV